MLAAGVYGLDHLRSVFSLRFVSPGSGICCGDTFILCLGFSCRVLPTEWLFRFAIASQASVDDVCFVSSWMAEVLLLASHSSGLMRCLSDITRPSRHHEVTAGPARLATHRFFIFSGELRRIELIRFQQFYTCSSDDGRSCWCSRRKEICRFFEEAGSRYDARHLCQMGLLAGDFESARRGSMPSHAKTFRRITDAKPASTLHSVNSCL